MIDLHSHTTASDGQHPADELLALAARAGVKTLAVTDHDTVKGLAQAEEAARREGITLVPGIELSADLDGREVHVLGHFVNPNAPTLARIGEELGADRERRMAQMVDKVRALGFPVSMEEVKALAKGAQLGRPHLALLLVDKGYCSSMKNAFDRFLARGKPAFVDRPRMSAEDAIALIHQSGGTATLAHPGTNRISRLDLERLRAWGLDGLEVYHPDHVPSAREKFLGWAQDLGLIATAGSDFHGEKVSPGRPLGAQGMTQDSLEALRARSTSGES
jgi:predicted metal-dependent phosphoesterase TrpH